jgi:natural product biosynthesis luciferase-like monooxygenase protein/amino acid adenylation domain-containing protein
MNLVEIRKRLQGHHASIKLTNGQLMLWGSAGARRDGELVALIRSSRADLIERIESGEVFDFTGGAAGVPASLLRPDGREISPDMLPLLKVSQAEIEHIVASVSGGVPAIQDIYPLTPLQEGMLFHYLMATEGDPYLLWSMTEFADRAVLDSYIEACNQVIARHDILRTALRWEGLREPIQIVQRSARLSVRTVELNPRDGNIADQLKTRFDPARFRIDLRLAPLATLIVARDDAHDRWIGMHFAHHLTTDRAAGDIMDSEVRAFMRGTGQQLPAPVPYRSFVALVQDDLTRSEHEAFFKGLLAGVDYTTAAFGLRDVHRDGSQIATAVTTLSDRGAARLLARARGLGVSVASILHTTWGHVLGRVCGIDKPVFGTVLFGRMSLSQSHEHAVGPSINTLPLVVDTTTTALEAIKEVQNRLADLFLHEHASLTLAQQCASLPQGVPLFTSVMNYRQSSARDRPLSESRPLSDLRMRFLGGHEANNYPLTVSVDDFGLSLRFTIQAVPGIDPHLMASLLQTSLVNILDALDRSAESRLRELPILGEEERSTLLRQWRGSDVQYPRECVHTLIEQQVDATPDATAVHAADRHITYGELDLDANQLAHQLRRQGVRQGDVVGVCMRRSIEYVVAILAIFKAGGVSLPLDPDYPRQRLEFLFQDSHCRVVLTTQDCAGVISWNDAARVIVGAFDASLLPVTRPDLPLSLEEPAYLLYTSGSTGKPKGLVGSHRALVSRLCPERARGRPVDVYAQKTSINFIDSFWEILMPLLTGASLVIFPREVVNDPVEFYRGLKERRVSHLVLVPTLLSVLVNELESHPDPLHALRYCVSSGEALSRELAARFQKLAPHVELVNIYGTTEFWDATAHRCSTEDLGTLAYLGFPLPNVSLYILDSQLQVVPPGVEGQLHVATPGLGAGYVDRPDLTKNCFLPNPFVAGSTMYKTGDKVRWVPEHGLEYLGRADQQIKLHGYRIEPKEIESALAALPGVGEAVVVEHDHGGSPMLCAYVVPHKATARQAKPIDFGLFYFSESVADNTTDPLALYLETVRVADRLGFDAVWTPERHFTTVGGTFPNPSVLSAAVAMVTQRVRIRAGSVVSPLHSPVRIAEEWAVVDRLSNGRVELSFASGWVPNDFVLAPDNFQQRHAVMLESVEQVKTLWRGGTLSLRNGVGAMVDIRTQPRPIQAELPVWITAAGAPKTFEDAGRIGANVLTHMLNTTLEGLAERVAVYRRARREAGFDPAAGKVALMLHTYVQEDAEAARAEARPHLQAYFRSQLQLRKEVGQSLGLQVDTTETVTEEIVAVATERYLATKALIGSPAGCANLLCGIQDAGVDEIACLVDFGISLERVSPALEHLDRLRRMTLRRLQPTLIREQLARVLPDFMIPTTVLLLDSLPLTPSGKVDRKRLPLPGSSHMNRSGYVAPRNAVEEKLAAIWAKVLRVEKVGTQDRFFDLGGNSMAAIRIINQTQKELGLKVSLRRLFDKQTIGALHAVTEATHEPAGKSALLRLKGGEGVPVFCFHGGAGTAAFYSKLTKYIDQNMSLYAFQYPPLVSGGPAYEDVASLARDFLARIREIQPSGPYRLLGWSFGGLTAFEIARQLQSAGESVAFLCLIDAHFNDTNSQQRVMPEEQALRYLLKLYGVAGEHEAAVSRGPAAVLELLKSNNLVPESFSDEEMSRGLSAIRDLVRMRSAYRPGIYQGRMTYIEARGEERRFVDAIAPWRSKVHGVLDISGVNASHYRIFDEPHVEEVGKVVSSALR